MNTKDAMKKAIDLAGSQAELARLLGLEPPTINQWLKGSRPVPPKRAIQVENLFSGHVKKSDLCPDFPWADVALSA